MNRASARMLVAGAAISVPLFLTPSSARGGTAPHGPGETRQHPPCTSPRQALNFPNYWAGPSFEGLPLTAVIRDCGIIEEDLPTRFNAVSYLYGDCNAPCALPIEIQTWPVQERYRELYELGPEEFQLPVEDTTFEGFPAIRSEAQLEIFRPDVTIVIFGDDRAQVDRFAAALVPGPVVLTELARYGLFFPSSCSGDVHYCVAKPVAKVVVNVGTRGIVDALAASPFLIPAGVPFLLALLVGRWWILLVPVVGWSAFYFAFTRGYESAFPLTFFFAIPIGVGAAFVGLAIRLQVRPRKKGRVTFQAIVSLARRYKFVFMAMVLFGGTGVFTLFAFEGSSERSVPGVEIPRGQGAPLEFEGGPVSIYCGDAWHALDMGRDTSRLPVTEAPYSIHDVSRELVDAALIEAAEDCESGARWRVLALGVAGAALGAAIFAPLRRRYRERIGSDPLRRNPGGVSGGGHPY